MSITFIHHNLPEQQPQSIQQTGQPQQRAQAIQLKEQPKSCFGKMWSKLSKIDKYIGLPALVLSAGAGACCASVTGSPLAGLMLGCVYASGSSFVTGALNMAAGNVKSAVAWLGMSTIAGAVAVGIQGVFHMKAVEDKGSEVLKDAETMISDVEKETRKEYTCAILKEGGSSLFIPSFVSTTESVQYIKDNAAHFCEGTDPIAFKNCVQEAVKTVVAKETNWRNLSPINLAQQAIKCAMGGGFKNKGFRGEIAAEVETKVQLLNGECQKTQTVEFAAAIGIPEDY